jgi:hypothetical protein
MTGVFDLSIAHDITGMEYGRELDEWLQTAFAETFGPIEKLDHILYCLPQGMAREFIAFAWDKDNSSFYSDPWCTQMSTTMHEVGHHLGMCQL